MRTNEQIREKSRIIFEASGEDGGMGWIPGLDRKKPSRAACVVWSRGCGWDHVSVSFKDRCPTWEEMCVVKDIFFEPEECCVEYHPPQSEYVNNHPFCLHIWKPQDQEIPSPPAWMVGIKSKGTMDHVEKECQLL